MVLGVQVMPNSEQNIPADVLEQMSKQELNNFLNTEELESTFSPIERFQVFCKEYPHGNIDPNGIGQHDGGAKLDAGKPDMSLLLMFGKALHATMDVGTGGKIKYSRGGWQNVNDGINRYTAAMLRHVFQEHYEEMDKDLVNYLGRETYHAAAVAWNALARLELMLREKENDKSIY
jgi:hypothetical protein